MARRPRLLFEGGIYHVTFRGNARQDIFLDTRDRLKMIECIAKSADRYQVVLYLYCFLSNHVHLLVHTPRANLDQMMGSLLTGYCVYFNRKHQRSGHVMQGRYGAQVVSGDAYLLNLSRYIHLNPVNTTYWRDKTKEDQIVFLRQYAWSSYRSYLGVKPPADWLSTGPILAMTPGANQSDPHTSYQEFVETGLFQQNDEFKRRIHTNPLVLGSDEFIRDITKRYQRDAAGRIKHEDAVLRREIPSYDPDEIRHNLLEINGFNANRLSHGRLGTRQRCAMALAWQKYSSLSQREVAVKLGLTTGAAISMLTRKYRLDPQVIQWLSKLDLTLKG